MSFFHVLIKFFLFVLSFFSNIYLSFSCLRDNPFFPFRRLFWWENFRSKRSIDWLIDWSFVVSVCTLFMNVIALIFLVPGFLRETESVRGDSCFGLFTGFWETESVRGDSRFGLFTGFWEDRFFWRERRDNFFYFDQPLNPLSAGKWLVLDLSYREAEWNTKKHGLRSSRYPWPFRVQDYKNIKFPC